MDFISQAIRGRIVEYDPEEDHEKALNLRNELPTAILIRIDSIFSYKDHWKIVGEYISELKGTAVCKGFLCIPGESKCGNSGGEEIATIVQPLNGSILDLNILFDRSGKGGRIYPQNSTVVDRYMGKVGDLWNIKELLDLKYPLYAYAFSKGENTIEFSLFPKGVLIFEQLKTELVLKLNGVVVSTKNKPLTEFEKFSQDRSVCMWYISGTNKLDISQFGSSVYWDGLSISTYPPKYILFVDETKLKEVDEKLTEQGFKIQKSVRTRNFHLE